jgi:transcriptional regulator with XRE-family HTH domain
MRLGQVIKKWRVMSELGIREVAKAIGTSPATLSRLERGEDTNGETLAQILKWLLSRETV